MEQLSSLDDSLYQDLLTQKLRFWYEPSGLAFFHRHFGIPKSYVAWKEQGVIACVLYAYFEAKLVHGRLLWCAVFAQPSVATRPVYATVRAWLEQHQFPAELVGFFD